MTVIPVMPNIEDGALFDGMCVNDAADDFAKYCAVFGNAVVTGCQVTQHAAGANMSVDVAAGTASVAGTLYTVAAVSGLTIAAAATADRRDMIVLRLAAGSVTPVVVQGAYPTGLSGNWNQNVLTSTCKPPVKGALVSTTDIPIAEVYVAYQASGGTTTTSILSGWTAGNIVDKRPLLSGGDVLGGILQATVNVESIIESISLDLMAIAQANVNLNNHDITNLAGITTSGLAIDAISPDIGAYLLDCTTLGPVWSMLVNAADSVASMVIYAYNAFYQMGLWMGPGGSTAADTSITRSAAGVVDISPSGTGSYGKGILRSGTDTSQTAAISSPSITSGSDKVLSTTQDVMLYINETTSNTWSLTMGPASSGQTTIKATGNPGAGTLTAIRVPKGWHITFTGTVADMVFTMVTC